MVQLEQKFKDQAVKTQDKPIRTDIINDLHLFQGGFQHFYFCLFNRIFGLIVPEKYKLLDIGNIFFHKIQRNLKNDSFIWNGTFCGMDDVGIDQDTISGVEGMTGRFHDNIQCALLYINDLNSPVPVERNVASIICGRIKFDICDT